MGLFWYAFRHICVAFRPVLGSSGPIEGVPGLFWGLGACLCKEKIWGHSFTKSAYPGHLGGFGVISGPFWVILSGFRGISGPFWANQGGFEGILGLGAPIVSVRP